MPLSVAADAMGLGAERPPRNAAAVTGWGVPAATGEHVRLGCKLVLDQPELGAVCSADAPAASAAALWPLESVCRVDIQATLNKNLGIKVQW
jgi:hypothetical protein